VFQDRKGATERIRVWERESARVHDTKSACVFADVYVRVCVRQSESESKL